MNKVENDTKGMSKEIRSFNKFHGYYFLEVN